MIAIYRGEDTDFAGQEPIQIKINTPLDLTGYTADLLFGSVVKHYETEEVATKTLGLSFSAAETSQFFPGKGYATIKVYDTNGKVAVLKRFVIDVRFRRYDNAPMSAVDIAELMQSFENIRTVAQELPFLTDEDGKEQICAAINAILSAAKRRDEFSPLGAAGLMLIPPTSIIAFEECIRKLEAIALNNGESEEGDSMEDIKHLVNDMIVAFGAKAETDNNSQAGVEPTLALAARQVGRILRTQRV